MVKLFSEGCFRAIHDSDRTIPSRNFYGSLEKLRPELEQLNQQGFGIFKTINKTDGQGRKEENITECIACLIDGDDIELPTQWGLNPHVITQRDHTHWHAYWLIEPTEDKSRWSLLQYQLGLYYGIKDLLTDPPRVMRVPGFNHLKDPNNPIPVTVYADYSNYSPYTLDMMENSHVLTQEQREQQVKWFERRKIKSSGIETYDDSEPNIERFQNRVRCLPVSEGEYNNTLFKAAAFGHDYGVSPDVNVRVITDWWNECWTIPLEPRTITRVVNNAYKHSENELGCDSVGGIFGNAPQITVEQQQVITKSLAAGQPNASTPPNMYGKNHTINAQLFLTDAKSDYITIEQETYQYTGTHWRKLDPKELEAHVLKAMIESRPTSDIINGTANIVRLMTADNSINKSPQWRVDGDRPNPKNFIIFRNGILDITTNQWIEHTSDLFYTHCCDYDYDSNATCEGWISFLNREVFNYDLELIALLQEWMGYMLVNNYEFQKLALFLGAPRSGKGTITGVLRELVGAHNVAAPTLTKLTKDSILDLMRNKPVAIIGDAHKVAYQKRDEVMEHLLMFTGGDSITFDRKYISGTTVKFPTRITMCANKMPDFIDTSGALAGRLLVIPFRNSYMGREDPKRLEKLLVETSGILNWCLEGLRRLQANSKFTEPSDSLEVLASLKEDLSPVEGFIEDCLTITGNDRDIVRATDVYNIYLRWCNQNERTPAVKNKFKADLLSNSYALKYRRRMIGDEKARCYTGVIVANNLANVTVLQQPPAREVS